MDYKLTKGKQSNYQIDVELSKKDMADMEKEVLKGFQKNMDLPGFRKGKVPLNIVKEKIQDHYLKMWVYEQVVKATLEDLTEENDEIQFIGNIYDLNPEESDDGLKMSFKLDAYPEVEELNQNWETVEMEEISKDITQDEIDETLQNLKKQNAKYEKADKTSKNTVNKVSAEFVSEDGESLDTASIMIGAEDIEEFDILEKFLDKSLEDIVELDYDPDNLPPYLHDKSGEDVDKVVCKITDIQERKLPELTDEKIEELFGKGGISTKSELEAKVEETLKEEKIKKELTGFADKLIEKLDGSLEVTIPSTMVDEETERRLEMLEQRVGGEEAFEKYKEQIGDKYDEMLQSMEKDAKSNLKNYFILNKYAQLAGIEAINWQKNLDAEKKIYAHIVGDDLLEKEDDKEETDNE